MTNTTDLKPNSFKVNLSKVLIGLDYNLRHNDSNIKLPDELTQELEKLVDYLCINCSTEVFEGSLYFRSRINPLNEDRAIPNHQMGPPPSTLTKSGRLAPAGIPALYLASTEKTAVYEIRPFQNAIVSIAQFTIRQTVKAIDFTIQPDILDCENECINWDTIKMVELSDKYFSAPAHSSDEKAYLYTQYLISTLRSRGFDAFIYRSAQDADGKNLVLFDPFIATCGEVKVVRVESVDYKFNEFQQRTQLSFPATGALRRTSPLM